MRRIATAASVLVAWGLELLTPVLVPAPAMAQVPCVTATDADDKLLPQANRGPQVAVAAPGVDILVPAPDGGYQITSGTSVAAAHASGVAALLLARKPDMTADEVRRVLIGTAQGIPGKRTDLHARRASPAFAT